MKPRFDVRAPLSGGTPPEWIEAAGWRGRFEFGREISRGVAVEEARRAVIGRFLREIRAESFGEFADETLMAAVRRGVDEASARVDAS